MKVIPLYDRAGEVIAHALVDDDDFERLGHHRWSLGTRGVVRTVTFRGPTGRKTSNTYRLHREVMGETDPRVQIDHRDRNVLNNQRSNLRRATNAENQQNRVAPITNRVGHRGVGVTRNGRFQARVQVGGKRRQLGTFGTPGEAAEVARKARAESMPFSPEAANA